MNDDDTLAPIPFSGDSGAEFLDGLADTLAGHVGFSGHGKLTPSERIAFVWGFRHGMHQLVGLMAEASEQGPKTLETIRGIVAAAVKQWDLGISVKVYTASNDEPPPDTMH